MKVVSAGNLKDDSGSQGGAGGKEKAVPTPLSIEDIKRYQKAFADSSKLAVEAGFDGIELHGAREFLRLVSCIHQITKLSTSPRSAG